jgi:hypothetical protein
METQLQGCEPLVPTVITAGVQSAEPIAVRPATYLRRHARAVLDHVEELTLIICNITGADPIWSRGAWLATAAPLRPQDVHC